MLGVLAALLVGIVTYHDGRHVWQVFTLWRRLRLPVFVASTAAVAVRFPLVWWSYLADVDALFLGAAFIGQTLVMLLYRLDVHAVQTAMHQAEERGSK